MNAANLVVGIEVTRLKPMLEFKTAIPFAKSPKLCDTFRAQSRWTWRMLNLSHRVSSRLGETSITEFNLLKIRQRHPTEIITKNFTQHQEAITGGDWEWWLTGKSGLWLGFRLQAKIVDVDSGDYPHLHYYHRSSGEHQSDILIKDSQLVGAIPLYCLYSCWPSIPSKLSYRCGSFRRSAYSFGCTLMQASVVQRLHDEGDLHSIGDVAEFLFPWHCLFCCHDDSDADLPRRAWAYWQATLRRSNQEFEATSNGHYGDIAPREQPPEYVQLLRMGDLLEAPDPRLQNLTVIGDSTNDT